MENRNRKCQLSRNPTAWSSPIRNKTREYRFPPDIFHENNFKKKEISSNSHTHSLSLSRLNMEPNDNQLASFYHHHQSSAAAAAAAQSPTNGLLPPASGPPDGGAPALYPHSAPSAAASPPLGPAKRKRGRPRKYGTPEQALAAKKAAGSSSSSSYKERKERGGLVGSSSSPGPYSGSSKKSQSPALGTSDPAAFPAGNPVANSSNLRSLLDSVREIPLSRSLTRTSFVVAILCEVLRFISSCSGWIIRQWSAYRMLFVASTLFLHCGIVAKVLSEGDSVA